MNAASLLQQRLLDALGAIDGRTDRVQPELFVSLRALGVVDAADDAGNLEDVLGDLRGHDVAVVAFGHRHEAVRVLDACPAQHLRVGAIADDLVAFEIVGQDPPLGCPGELVRVSVDDGHVVSAAVHFGRDLGSDSTAANDHDLHIESIIGRAVKAPSGPDTRALAWFAVRFPFPLLGLMAIAIGVWVAVYLTVHPGLDPVSNGLAFATAVGAFAFWGDGVVGPPLPGPGKKKSRLPPPPPPHPA